MYDRKENKIKENTFSDCADITLLHLCNCLFYDGEKYSLDHLSENAPIRKFYEKHATLFQITEKTRED